SPAQLEEARAIHGRRDTAAGAVSNGGRCKLGPRFTRVESRGQKPDRAVRYAVAGLRLSPILVEAVDGVDVACAAGREQRADGRLPSEDIENPGAPPGAPVVTRQEPHSIGVPTIGVELEG